MNIFPYDSIPFLHKKATLAAKSNQLFFKQLKKKTPKDFLHRVLELHFAFFENFDCLKCANCCNTLGPLLNQSDIDRIANTLKIKTKQFIEKYLKIDEDHDFVFKQMPCPFLNSDNYCAVYQVLPKACKEYPHTDHKRFDKILDISLKNTYTCPAVYSIVEELKLLYADTKNQHN